MDKKTRRRLLAQILKQILAGDFNSATFPFDKFLPMQTSVRQEYQAPPQRDTNNYGYMNVWEMGAGEKPF